MPQQILTDQGSVFTSKIWKERLRANGCKLRLIPIESHNSQDLVENKHNHLRKTFQRVKTDFLGIGEDLALIYAVKARNDVANPKGLVPSMLVFGTMPRLFPTDQILSSIVVQQPTMRDTKQ
jgi:transposase InsO family protein